jgi:flagellar protein FlgJ
VYRNVTDSIVDHGRFLVVNSRYKRAFAYRNNPDQFAVELKKAGYATSPTYAQNLQRLMRLYNLYRYDIRIP